MAKKNSLNVDEAALLLGLTPRSVRAYCAWGRLKAQREGRGEWSIEKEDVDAYLVSIGRKQPQGRKLSHDPWCLCSRCRGVATNISKRADLVDLHLFVSKELKTRLAIACREDHTDVSTIAKEALGMWLERREEVRGSGT